MGHYDDGWEEKYYFERKRQRAKNIEALDKLRMSRNEILRLNGGLETMFNQMEDYLKARLYECPE